MVREKTKKLRGGHYGRGWKAGRGKGKRGGSGNAGMGKHRWIWMLKYDRLHLGGKGFVSHHRKAPENPINISKLNQLLQQLERDGYATRDGDAVTVDLRAAGYTRLLGAGVPEFRGHIKVARATQKAINKLSNHGVTVEVDGGDSEE
ncbi:50S ribosomal protein L15 [Thermogymnomonas acidicola]|uniref:Large ribosomal subunit protein uL15 n=1 Tax=Thermogymnomonas acidicola TaxID=399579 RepID=A0AA37BQV9_9ARCH|nr:uL15 family ribosomal protein [Thermogymnomonas acidicola]GGM72093.1 50S ribosomal protein L15 [Thermogymnomonas acidicola]